MLNVNIHNLLSFGVINRREACLCGEDRERERGATIRLAIFASPVVAHQVRGMIFSMRGVRMFRIHQSQNYHIAFDFDEF
jgi:hypothetical protein